jgi:diguanylate cyclase (GGDEF)-like protein/PAS domain S-box-containing protein
MLFLTLCANGIAQALTIDNQVNSASQKINSDTHLKNDTLIVGSESDYPPFATGMTDATAGGFTVDLWKAVATEAGLKYEIRVLPFHELLQEFRAGNIDVLINLATSSERHAFADFTVPHSIIHGGIFVRKGESHIRSEADLAGKSIILINADLAHDYAVSKGWEKQLVLVDTATEGMTLLASGKYDAMLISKLAGLQTMQALGLTNIEGLKPNAGFSQKFAFAVREGHSELFSAINEGLALTKSNGTYNKLYEKWFGLYEVKEVGWLDLLKYLLPVVLLFIGFAQYVIYRRNTERRKSESKLQASDERHRAILDTAMDGFWQADLQGHLLDVNATYCQMSGYSEQELLTMHILDLEALESKNDTAAHIQMIISQGEARFETQHRRKDGSVFDVEVSVHYRAIDGGRLIVFLRDITERKQSERKLGESESHLRAIIKNEPDCIKIVDARGRLVQMNPAGLAMLEAETLDQVTARPLLSFVMPEFHAAFTDLLERVLAGESMQLEFEMIGLNGGRRWLETHAVPMMKKGEYVLLGVTRDITERKKTAQRIEQLLAEKNAVLENRLVGIATMRDRKILWANLAFEIMFGYSQDELIGMSTRQLYVNDEDHQMVGAAYACIESEGIVRLQSDFVHKDGQHLCLNISGTMLNKETGESLWVFVDVTELKHAESALAETHYILQTIIDTAPVRIFWKDKDLRYLGCNPAFAKDAGMASPYDLIGKDDYEMGWAAQADLYRADDRTILDTGIAKLFYDEPQTTPTGQIIWLRTAKVPLKNKDNQTVGLLGIYEEITDHKLAENDLRIAATAFESQEGILVTDANNIILRVNRAFTQITGYRAEDVIGQAPNLLGSGHHDAGFYEAMWASINVEGFWEGEIWNRRKSGEVYPEHLVITAVKDEAGMVTNYVATLNDIALNKAAAEEIHHLAFYDALTRLPNRRLLLDRLKHALAASTRNGKEGAVLFLDLDHFKTLNDTLGHDIGDLLLQQVAERLVVCVREGDTVARLGGDEYVIMLEALSEHDIEAAAQAEVIGKKILIALNKPYHLGGHEYHCTSSIGITLFNDHKSGIEELLKQADIAMYQAKKSGRNTLRFFDPEMQDALHVRVDIERELRKALEKKQFHLYYQIQVESSGRPIGAEVLIRWLHPERGLVSPNQFIPLAEETGLILPIGQWVLESVCAQLKAWEQNTLTCDLTLSLNVSPKQFRQTDFMSQVKTAVEHYAINPRRLKFELTESILLENIEDTIATMSALKDIGIRFSLDDFGTGYSSLQYLKILPLYQLKIDQSFVRDIAVDSSNQAIVCTIIAMARTLKLNVIAEGVESEEQYYLLLNNDCTHYQGYLFGKPVPIVEFEALLE